MLLQKQGTGDTTQRSQLLSNQSKPTSYGAGSGSIKSLTKTTNQVLRKTTLGGLLGSGDHIWSSRGGVSGVPKGVRSETGSMHNVSNNQAPYQDNQSVKSRNSKHSKHSSMNQGGGS